MHQKVKFVYKQQALKVLRLNNLNPYIFTTPPPVFPNFLIKCKIFVYRQNFGQNIYWKDET